MLMVQYKPLEYFQDWMTDGENFISKIGDRLRVVPIHTVEVRADITVQSIDPDGKYMFASGLPVIYADTITEESMDKVRDEYPEIFI